MIDRVIFNLFFPFPLSSRSCVPVPPESVARQSRSTPARFQIRCSAVPNGWPPRRLSPNRYSYPVRHHPRPYQVFYQCHRLLCRMVEHSRPKFFGHIDDRCRIFPIRDTRGRRFHCAITAVRHSFEHSTGMVLLTGFVTHLRMIYRLFLIEYQNILVLSQGHTVGIEMPRHPIFLPHEVVPPHFGLG